jgi:hypothetical protein
MNGPINPGYARKGAAQSLVEEMENPSAMGSAPEVMLPMSLFPKGCKEGTEVMVKGTVGKMGSKVGFTPTEVTYEGGMDNADEEKAEGE